MVLVRQVSDMKRDMSTMRHEVESVHHFKEDIDDLRDCMDKLQEQNRRRKLRLLEQVQLRLRLTLNLPCRHASTAAAHLRLLFSKCCSCKCCTDCCCRFHREHYTVRRGVHQIGPLIDAMVALRFL